MGKSKTRMFAWSTMTAKFVNSSMATPNVGEPGIPKVCCVLKGFEMLSTIEIVLLAELEVRIAPVWGLMAREVGLMPTRSEERRVGKECRARWSREIEKKKRDR